VALRPRLSPGGLFSRCNGYAKAVSQGCQASPGVETEEFGAMVRVNPNRWVRGFANTA
jgi:hypothetical protein